MIKKICNFPRCKDNRTGKPKVIEGYTQHQVEYMMKQHLETHNKKKKEVKKNGL